MAQLTVTFHPSGHSASVPPQTTVLEAAASAGLPLHSPCGGQGRCGKCAVRAVSGMAEPTAAERATFSEEELKEGWRLACQARVVGDGEVFVPASAVLAEHWIEVKGAGREVAVEPSIRKIAVRLPEPTNDDPRPDLSRVMDAFGKSVSPAGRLSLLQRLPGVLRESRFEVTAVTAGDFLLGVEPGDTSEDAYGLAVDVGTTTVAAYLCHLPTGEVRAVASDLNRQARHGEDVISRLQMAVSDEQGLPLLTGSVVEVVNDLLTAAVGEAGLARESVYEMVVVGNTCMTHFLLGVPPDGLAQLPFVPSFREAQTVLAGDLGVAINPEGLVYVMPNIGGFVGADTVGVILASGLDRAEGLWVAVDIGTNGEIVVARDGELRACSTAAGPAFEGARISCGMRAATGAIDALTIEEDVSYHVLGDAPARGLCGSGLVDAVAELVKAGVVTEGGRLRKPEEVGRVSEKVRRRLAQNQDGMEFVLAFAAESGTGRDITLTARDIRQTQLAKGAIYTGIAMMLEEVGAAPAEVERLLLAGAFGNYIRRESAVAIGLIPALEEGRIESIGNAAGVGARLALVSAPERRRAEEIARATEHVELAKLEGFYDRFADAMMLRPLPAAGERAAGERPRQGAG